MNQSNWVWNIKSFITLGYVNCIRVDYTHDEMLMRTGSWSGMQYHVVCSKLRNDGVMILQLKIFFFFFFFLVVSEISIFKYSPLNWFLEVLHSRVYRAHRRFLVGVITCFKRCSQHQPLPLSAPGMQELSHHIKLGLIPA